MQIRFGPFTLDLDARQLSRGRSSASAQAELRRDNEIHLSPKAFDLLAALVQERPNVLSKATLQERIWPDTFVAEANVANLVAEVREVLEDEARAPRFIRTVHGVGYAFCADAVSLPAVRDTLPARPACWLQWGDVRFPLVPGGHVVGRDPDVEIRLDRSTVSRRHARFVVATDGTVLEDFGSKNGTYRGSERVTTPVALIDGDEIRIGSVQVTFHLRAPNESTETQVASRTVTPGTRIGPYEIVAWIGAGGMGEVYRARDARLGREVAIKVIATALATDPGRVHRFEQEARAAGQLNHPNILAVYDAGVHDGAPYIVSELLEGESVRSRLKAGAVPARKAIDYARQTAEGISAAHDKGIVHRDLKPDNLFITKDGRIKILDFGIAKLTTPGTDASPNTGAQTDTAAGTIMGTVGYMSPEQVRGEAVDARSDIFSIGTVLHEMLTGRPPFSRGTAAESMTAILREEPADPLPADVPPALARIIARCLEKTREARFQSARDLAFGLDVLSGTHGSATPETVVVAPRRWRTALGVTIVVVGLLATAVIWLKGTTSPSFEQRFAGATFTPFTNFEGSELDAAISPDGKFVAFMADRDGPFHPWLKQVSAGDFIDLTRGMGDLRNPGPQRHIGFSADGAELWINGTRGRPLAKVPLMGGAPRAFLPDKAINVAWAPDGERLVYFTSDGDPLVVADRTGNNPREILPKKGADHNHFPAWSTDGEWIYYVHGNQSLTDYDVWRIRPSGGTPEQLTNHHGDVRYLTPIDPGTILYVAREQDGSGPWLWALDADRRVTRRVGEGLNRYWSIAASADGRRLVASVATSTAASLSSVPILDRIAEEADVQPYAPQAGRASAPRFGKAALFYLSSTGAGDGLWRFQAGKTTEIWKGSDGALLGPAGVSPDGDRVALVLSRQGKRLLTRVSVDGGDHQSLAPGIDIRGNPSWSPDGKWIVSGGNDAQGPALFLIPVDGSQPVRLVSGAAFDPVMSPVDNVIVYAGQQFATAPLLAVRTDQSAVALPPIRVPNGGGGRARFLSDGRLVYMQGSAGAPDFWVLDLITQATRPLTRLSNPATTTTFDIAPDGKHIVFDRVRERSDIVLIDLPKQTARR